MALSRCRSFACFAIAPLRSSVGTVCTLSVLLIVQASLFSVAALSTDENGSLRSKLFVGLSELVGKNGTNYTAEVVDDILSFPNKTISAIEKAGVLIEIAVAGLSELVRKNGTNSTAEIVDDILSFPNKTISAIEEMWVERGPCVSYVSLAAVLAFLSFFIALPCLLLALGFGVIGIAFGSLAALFQAKCGTPVCFRMAQSFAMLRFPLSCHTFFGAIIFAAVSGWISYAIIPSCHSP